MPLKKHAVDDDFESPRNVVTESNVDYLSYKFDVMDLAASWRALTKQKLTVVNGLRLENASWRTWAKQKNNLKTINPDTLNWLKDSDVTWLYGPLHTVIKNMDEEDRYAKPKTATTEETMGLITSSSQQHNQNDKTVLSPFLRNVAQPSTSVTIGSPVDISSIANNSSPSTISRSSVSPQKPLKSALKKVTMSDLLKRSASEMQLNTINTVVNGDTISEANQQLGEFSPAVIASHRQPKLRFNQYVEQFIVLPHAVEDKRKSKLKFSDLNDNILEEDTTTSDEDYDPDGDSEPESLIRVRRPSRVRSVKKIEPALLKSSARSDHDSMDSSEDDDEDDGLNIPTSFNRRRSSTFQPRRKSSSAPITAEDWEAEGAESDALVKHIIRVSKGKVPIQHRDPAADKMPSSAVNYPEDSDISNVNQEKSDYEYHFDDDDWDTHSEHVEDDPFSFASHQKYSPIAPSVPVGCQVHKAPVNNESVLPAIRTKSEKSSSDTKSLNNLHSQYQSDDSGTSGNNSSSSFFNSIAHWASSHLWPSNNNDNTK